MHATTTACAVALLAFSAAMMTEASGHIGATLALKCSRDIDLTLMSDYQLSSFGLKLGVAIADDCELDSDMILAHENVTAVNAQVLGVEFVDVAAMASFETCVDDGKVRFKRCSVIHVRPANPCDDVLYRASANVELRRVPLAKQVDGLDNGALQVFASKFHDATVDKCGLDFCDVKAFLPGDITPMGGEKFSVLVRDDTVVDALQNCSSLQFMRMRINAITSGVVPASTTSISVEFTVSNIDPTTFDGDAVADAVKANLGLDGAAEVKVTLIPVANRRRSVTYIVKVEIIVRSSEATDAAATVTSWSTSTDSSVGATAVLKQTVASDLVVDNVAAPVIEVDQTTTTTSTTTTSTTSTTTAAATTTTSSTTTTTTGEEFSGSF